MAEEIVSLVAAAELPASQVGGKARSLGRLSQAGFPVPSGFCIPVDAFATSASGHLVSETVLSADVVEQVRMRWTSLRAPHGVAVRSSATTEDGAASSAAGQYLTVLSVRTFDELLVAIGRCRQSRDSATAGDYRNRLGLDPDDVAMAVVVQAMVAPNWAGVVFTAEGPVADDDHMVLVEAVPGLGEGLVDGVIEPDRAVFSRTGRYPLAFRTAFGEPHDQAGADEEALRTLVTTAMKIERMMGAPQDIEWALDDDGVHILQARPITVAVPRPTQLANWVSEIPGARWARMSICDSWLSEPLSPLFATTLYPRLVDRWTTNWGGPPAQRAGNPLIPDPMHGTVNGFAYLRFDFPLSRYPLRTLRLSWRWLAFHLSSVEREWRDRVLPGLKAALADAEGADLTDLEVADVQRRVVAVEEATARYWAVIGGLAWHWNAAEWLLGAVLARLGERAAAITPGSLLAGEDRFGRRADLALDRIAKAPAESEDELLRHYLQQYGHLVYSLDLAEPTAVDDPSVLRSVVAGRRGDTAGGRRDGDGERERGIALIGSFGRGPTGRLLRRVHRWADHWSGVRDAALHSFTHGWPFMRAGYVEIGRRLVAAGLLDAADDVFYLTGDELRRWVDGGDGNGRWRHEVRERRRRRGWQQRLSPPDVVPTDARIMLFGVDITALALFGVSQPDEQEQGLSGSAVSPGRYTGRARVVHQISQADSLEKGEVLVVRHVTPAWAPLLARAGAVVADVGGALSHGSVVAREYALPAVMGVKSATAQIVSGDLVTVDGSSGTVQVQREP